MTTKTFTKSLASMLVATTALVAPPALAGTPPGTAGGVQQSHSGSQDFALAVLALLASEGSVGREPGYRHPHDFPRPSPERPYHHPGKGALPHI